MGVQGAKPPAGARGVPALSPFPKRLGDDALVVALSLLIVVSARPVPPPAPRSLYLREMHPSTKNQSFFLSGGVMLQEESRNVGLMNVEVP
jgi:hypothetical protein